MTFDEVYETLPGNGWLSRAEAELLWRHAVVASGPILEVGCNQGRSTVLLALTGRPVYAVDPFEGFDADDPDGRKAMEALWRNLLDRGIANVEVFVQRIEDWRPRPVGVAYLDGDHTYGGTAAQIEKALACRPEVVAIHDVNDSGGGLEVKKAAVFHLGAWTERVERLAVWRLR